MGYFNRDNKSGERSNYRQMHKTICSSCNRECEVPFKPSGNKPVYCSSCFEKNKGSSDTRRFSDRNFNRPVQNNEQYNTINAKLDKILTMLTSPPLTKSENPVIIVKKKKKVPKKTTLPPVA